MSKEYKPVFMDAKDGGYFEKENKGIFRFKFQILLVGFILYQGYLYMQKKEDAPEQPSRYAAGAQAIASGDPFQAQLAAKAEAERMMNSGDTSNYEEAIQNNPELSRILGRM